MNSFKGFLDKALKFFGLQRRTDTIDTTKYVTEYLDKLGVNFNYIGSNKLSNHIAIDSTINVTNEARTDSPRLELLRKVFNREWLRIKWIVQRVLGVGKIAMLPYVNEYNKLIVDYVMQNQFVVVDDDGEQPICVIVAVDTCLINTTKYGKGRRYMLVGNTCYITHFYADLSGGNISETPPAKTGWEYIKPIVIENCEQLPLAFITSPIDSRSEDKYAGVGLLDGADEIIKRIRVAQEDIAREYRVGKSFIIVDKNLLTTNKDGKQEVLDETFISAPMDSRGGNSPISHNPLIRSNELFMRLENEYKLLEKHIGVSDGIFSDAKNIGTYSNKSNIKRAIFDTYSFITSARMSVEQGFRQLLTACNIIAEFYQLSPVGYKEAFDIQFNWSSAAIEDSAEEFNQVMQLQGANALSKAETRQWFTGEALEVAQDKVDEIKATQPVMDFGFHSDMSAGAE